MFYRIEQDNRYYNDYETMDCLKLTIDLCDYFDRLDDNWTLRKEIDLYDSLSNMKSGDIYRNFDITVKACYRYSILSVETRIDSDGFVSDTPSFEYFDDLMSAMKAFDMTDSDNKYLLDNYEHKELISVESKN